MRTMTPNVRRAALLVTGALLATPGTGQPIGPLVLEPVNPGFDDVGPLSRSLRMVPMDLRAPSEFDRVYRHPFSSDLFIRADGGLWAVFPRSDYIETEMGGIPVIPPGTRFLIGDPSPMPWESPPSELSIIDSRRADGRMGLRIDADRVGSRSAHGRIGFEAQHEPSSGIWLSDAHRMNRVRTLLRQAASSP